MTRAQTRHLLSTRARGASESASGQHIPSFTMGGVSRSGAPKTEVGMRESASSFRVTLRDLGLLLVSHLPPLTVRLRVHIDLDKVEGGCGRIMPGMIFGDSERVELVEEGGVPVRGVRGAAGGFELLGEDMVGCIVDLLGSDSVLPLALCCSALHTLVCTSTNSDNSERLLLPPRSNTYFLSTPALASYGLTHLRPRSVRWTQYCARRGMLEELGGLRAQHPPCAWNEDTMLCAAECDQRAAVEWLRSQSPPVCICVTFSYVHPPPTNALHVTPHHSHSVQLTSTSASQRPALRNCRTKVTSRDMARAGTCSVKTYAAHRL